MPYLKSDQYTCVKWILPGLLPGNDTLIERGGRPLSWPQKIGSTCMLMAFSRQCFRKAGSSSDHKQKYMQVLSQQLSQLLKKKEYDLSNGTSVDRSPRPTSF